MASTDPLAYTKRELENAPQLVGFKRGPLSVMHHSTISSAEKAFQESIRFFQESNDDPTVVDITE